MSLIPSCSTSVNCKVSDLWWFHIGEIDVNSEVWHHGRLQNFHVFLMLVPFGAVVSVVQSQPYPCRHTSE